MDKSPVKIIDVDRKERDFSMAFTRNMVGQPV